MCDVFDIDDYCSVYIDTRVKAARKEHRCDSCDTVIAVGQGYLRNFHVYEGEASSEKVCGACADVYERFAEAHQGSYTPASLWRSLEQCIEGADADDEDAAYWREKQHELNERRREARAS